MYVVFGNDIVDSNDIKNLINSDSDFNVESDLTKSTNREDVVALKVNIKTDKILCDCSFDQYNEESFDEYMEKSEDMLCEFLGERLDNRLMTGAYKWDEVNDSIYLILVVSDISLSPLKLKDIFARLIRQND